MLLLPVLGIWLLTTFAAKKHWLTQKIFWQTLGVVLMAFFLNSLLAGIVNPGGQLFTNYGFTLYGIADGGSGWEQFFIDHPEVRQVDETEAAHLSYRYAMEKLRDNPLPALRSIGASLLDFFSI